MSELTVSNACAQLLERSLGYQPLYGDRLSNHLPMALVASDRMGASPDQLHAFFAHYTRRLSARTPSSVVTDPMQCIGQTESFESVAAFFQKKISAQGDEPILKQWLPILFSGVGASAFHPLIRLAYALETCNSPEIALALASWTTEHSVFGSIGNTTSATPDEIARAARPAVAGRELGPGIIADRMRRAGHLLGSTHTSTQPASIELNDVASFALRAYCAREDFTLLHLVTASHAVRIVLGYLRDEDRDGALRHFWHAALVAYLSLGDPPQPLERATISVDGDWSECFKAASRSLDDHVIKLTYTAWQEATFYGDLAYLHIARRKNSLPLS